MFAVFKIVEGKKKQISTEYGNRSIAFNLKNRMKAECPSGEFFVRQKVKEEGQSRGSWRDL